MTRLCCPSSEMLWDLNGAPDPTKVERAQRPWANFGDGLHVFKETCLVPRGCKEPPTRGFLIQN